MFRCPWFGNTTVLHGASQIVEKCLYNIIWRQSFCSQTSAAFSLTSCTRSAISGVQGGAGIQKQLPTQVLGLKKQKKQLDYRVYNSSYIYFDYLALLMCTQTLYTPVFVKQLPQSRQEFILAGRPTSRPESLKCSTRGGIPTSPHILQYITISIEFPLALLSRADPFQ